VIRKNGVFMRLCKILLIICAVAVSSVFMFSLPEDSSAGEIKIATISLQDVLAESKVGQDAQKVLENEVQKFQNKFKKDQDDLEALRIEIEKKGSVWSDEIRQGKERDYQKKMREYKLKTEDAQFELKQLEKKEMEPILKVLHEVINEIGKTKNYTMIIENTRKGLRSRIGLLYAADEIDISKDVRVMLDKKYKK
jgi:outer membrane protein